MADTAHSTQLVCVAIPMHKSQLTPLECISLAQCSKILGDHPTVLFAPHSLEIGVACELLPQAEVIRLNERWFESIDSYNRLMLSNSFYERFTGFEYMLIYQPDAFVFSDCLSSWCVQGFDYIGAPWPAGDQVYPHNFPGAHRLHRFFPFWNKPRTYYVGNGGLSLRKVSSCLRMLQDHADLAARWPCNEDIFWPHIASIDEGRYHLPSKELAARFAIEHDPKRQIEASEGQLPFGCHGWLKIETDFWFPLIRSQGYAL